MFRDEQNDSHAWVWTTIREVGARKISRDKIVRYKVSVTDGEVLEKFDAINFDSDEAYVVEIFPVSIDSAFVTLISNGNYYLYLVNQSKQKKDIQIKKIDFLAAPAQIRFVNHSHFLKDKTLHCVNIVRDFDREKSELASICEDSSTRTIISKGFYSIRSATQTGGSRLLFITGENTGFSLLNIDLAFDSHDFYATGSFAAGPRRKVFEWIDGLTSDPDLGPHNYLIWKFNGDGFSLGPIHLPSDPQPVGTIAQPTEPFSEPVVQINAELQKALQASSDKNRSIVPPETSVLVRDDGKTFSVDAAKTFGREAPFENRHLLTYPLVVPPPFGGWSFGLISVPFIDEMERHRLQIQGVYRSESRFLSADVSYINNRIFDFFQLSLVNQERYNGSSLFLKNNKFYEEFSYLRETGVDSQFGFSSNEGKWVLSVRNAVAALSPLLGTRSSAVGVQKTVLGTSGLGVSAKPVSRRFLVLQKLSNDNDLGLSVEVNARGSYSQGVGNCASGEGQSLPCPRFWTTGLSQKTEIIYRNLALSLRTDLSGTLGRQHLNLRQIYQPYATYLLGSSQGINYQNYALSGNGALFARYYGKYALKNSVSLQFPLVSSVDKAVLWAYLDRIDGEVIASRGGIFKKALAQEQFVGVTAASASAKLTVDIKGFKVLPGLSVGCSLTGRCLPEVFAELAFSQFL